MPSVCSSPVVAWPSPTSWRFHPRVDAWIGRGELRRFCQHRGEKAQRKVLLRSVLLPSRGIGVIDSAARGAWRALGATCFIARRVRADVGSGSETHSKLATTRSSFSLTFSANATSFGLPALAMVFVGSMAITMALPSSPS